MQRLGLRLSSASTRSPSAATSLRIRWLHQRQPLPKNYEEEAFGKFLPPDALKVQHEWHDGLLERLNEQVAHTAEASSTTIQTIINLAGNKSKILAFNYASLALNNDFFLSNLKPPSEKTPTYEHEIAPNLMQNIREHHGGIEQLRSAFSAAALGTFTNGWVWFVSDQAGSTSTITTYGPSTLLIRSRMSMLVDPTLSSDPRAPISLNRYVPSMPPPTASPTPPSLPEGDMPVISSSPNSMNTDASFMSTAVGIYSSSTTPTQRPKKANFLNTGEVLYPLFCLPVYEHAWMSAGYGVWGKEQWLKEFWSVLDWKKVNDVYDEITQLYQYKSYT